MQKHQIVIEATSLGHLTTVDLRMKIEDKLRSLGIILAFQKFEVISKGDVSTRQELPKWRKP